MGGRLSSFAGTLAALLLALAAPASAERAAPARVDFAALRLASVPLPGCHDERAVHETAALEVFLSPSDFPDALLRLSLAGDAALFAVNVDATARSGQALPARVRWPRLGGRSLEARAPVGALELVPPPSGPAVSAEDLDADDLVLEWFLQPEETEDDAALVGRVRAVRLASAEGRTLLEWLATDAAAGCADGADAVACAARGAPRVVRSLAVHPSGRWLAVAGGDLRPRVDVVAVEGLAPLRRVTFPPWLGPPLGADFTADGRTLVVADGAGTLHLWDAGSGGLHRTLAARARAFALFDAGRLVAVADEGGGVTLWRLRDGTVATRLGTPGGGTSPLLAASGDGRRVAAVDSLEGRASIVLWEVEGGRAAGRVDTAEAGLVALLLDETGERLLASQDRRGLLAYRVGGPGGLEPWAGEPGRRCRGALALSQDRSRLACATRRGALVLDAATGALLQELRSGDEGVSALAFTPDGGSLVATAGGSILSFQLAPAARSGGSR